MELGSGVRKWSWESGDRRWSWKTELEDGISQVDASAAGGGLANSLFLKLKSKEPEVPRITK